ncbi:MAG: hypothetical protein ACSLEZ_07515 [Thiobacillus sp.]
MAATIYKIRLSAFFHTRRKMQTFRDAKNAVTHCFNWDLLQTLKSSDSHPGSRFGEE